MSSATRISCLCCGTRYDLDDNCPKLDELPHSLALARLVALHLLGHGIDTPTPRDVREAREAIDAEARVLIDGAFAE